MKRKTITAILFAAAMTMLTACGSLGAISAEPDDTEVTDEQSSLITIGFSQIGSESDWRMASTKSVQEAFTVENGYNLIYNDGQQKQENQLKAIREFIDQDVDYILLDPCVENGWDSALMEAKEAGIPANWLKAAQNSPVYKMVKEWQVALPLHAEYRTLPMVWYVPPLSPITRRAEADVYLPAVQEMRIPLSYIAELFAAGNVSVVEKVLQRLLDMRMVMRTQETGEKLSHKLEYDVETYKDMYRLMGIAKYKDRFNIPAGLTGESQDKLRELQGSCGYNCPGGC